MYDVEKIIYLLLGMFVFGNTCLFMGIVMTIEDKKNEKRKRKSRPKAKAKAKPKPKKKPFRRGREELEDISNRVSGDMFGRFMVFFKS